MSCLYLLAIRTEIGDLLRVTSFARFEGNSVTWTSRYPVQVNSIASGVLPIYGFAVYQALRRHD